MPKDDQFKSRELTFRPTQHSGPVSALYLFPKDAKWLLVFGHGAGAGMKHPFMETVAQKLAANGIATFRYQFLYMEQKSRRPDPKPVLLATVRSAVEQARTLADSLPLLAGGKSMGGRMTSNAAAEKPLEGVRGIVFFGFPLHPPGKPSAERADHLGNVTVPMLFLQGTKDKLADLSLLRPVCTKLGSLATLHIVDNADHSFHLPKSNGRSDSEVIDELASVVRRWSDALT